MIVRSAKSKDYIKNQKEKKKKMYEIEVVEDLDYFFYKKSCFFSN